MAGNMPPSPGITDDLILSQVAILESSDTVLYAPNTWVSSSAPDSDGHTSRKIRLGKQHSK